MKRTNTLILVNQTDNMYFPENLRDTYIAHLYKSEKYWHRVIRKIIFKLNIPLEKKLFSHWISYISKVDKIIIFDTGNIVYIIKWLNKNYPNIRVITWYWNSVLSSVHPELISDLKTEIWSFDKNDCIKYDMKYNTQFYISENMCTDNNWSFELKDVFYVGADKNRACLLHEMRNIFEKYNISYYFHLVRYKKSTNNYGIQYKSTLKYNNVLYGIKGSKAVIDLVADWQNGLTLRPLEALFFKKKLITNMKDIYKYDIYNPQNIFVWGIDDIDNLYDFINSPFDESQYDKLLEKYELSSWLARFDNI